MRWTERAEDALRHRAAEAQPSSRSLLLVLAAVNALSLALILAGGRVEAGVAVDAAFAWCRVPW